MFSNRTFGVEIEFIGSRSAAVQALRDAGLEASEEGYNHSSRPYWKVTTDASIGYNNGELVSPVLRGEQGLADLQKACRALVAAGHRVNRDCGVHVHVGASDLSAQEVAATCIRYSRQERTFDSIMPTSRRARNNRFCDSMTNYNINLEGASTVDRVARMMDNNRYVKLNVQSYLRQKTLEFRQHSGSLNATKICNWVKVCTKFVDTTVTAFRATSARNVVAAVATTTSRSIRSTVCPYRRFSLKANIYNALVEGTTLDQITESYACSAASAATTISQIKADPRTPMVKRFGWRGSYLYKFVDATPTDNTVSYQEPQRDSYRTANYDSVFNLGAYHGLEDSIVGYYEERAMELAH